MSNPAELKVSACVVPYPHPAIQAALNIPGWTTTGEADQADVLIWAAWGRPPEDIPPLLTDRIRWVQLTVAGVERFVSSGVVDDRRIWTSGADAYSDQVAEQALALLLAVRHQFEVAARTPRWQPAEYEPLGDSAVLIVGAGGIGRRLCLLLSALGTKVTAVNRSGQPVPGAVATWPTSVLADHWGDAPNIVLAAPNTPETYHMVNKEALARMQEGTCLVNVGRGELVDTDALLEALRSGSLGGAGLDVTEPEPLPPEHPLWGEPRAMVTSHSANPTAVRDRSLARRVGENARLFSEGKPLLGVINLALSY